MIRQLTLALAFGLALTAQSAAAQNARAPVVDVAAEDAAPLWSRLDGTGFANDVVRAAFKAAGVEVKFHVVPYARCKRMLTAGSVVACFSMSMDPDLKGSVLFPSIPIFTCYTELVQNPAHPLAAKRLRDLPRGAVVGSVLGYEYPEPILRAVKDGAIVLDESQSEELLLRKLSAGRIPAALVNVNDSKSLAYLNAVAHASGNAVRVERVGVLQSYLGFSARHANAKWALAKYEEGMRSIEANGRIAAIAHEWADSAASAVAAAQGGNKRPRE